MSSNASDRSDSNVSPAASADGEAHALTGALAELLPGFEETSFEHEGARRAVYRRLVQRGATPGPAVVVMHEIPGITPPVARFAARVASEGFSVFLPCLFGTPGRPLSLGYAAGQIARACVSREFSVLAAGASSPVTVWLRALAREASRQTNGGKVGALGMCLTGNFGLALAVEPVVGAPVLSQPSLPFGLTPEHRAGLHVSEAELTVVRQRVEREGLRVLGLRFTADPACPPERFRRLSQALGDGFEAVEIDSSAGNRHGIRPWAHSVVTNDLVDEAGHPTQAALHRVLAFFREALG